jgi:uncharacterized protein (TIGR03382 family)
MQTRAASVTIAALLVATLTASTGCGRPAGRPIQGDDAPEAFVGQARLLEVFSAQDGWLVSPLLEAPSLASRVAVWLSTSPDAIGEAVQLEARGYDERGAPLAWRPVDITWDEGVQRVGRVDLGVLVDAIEVRVPASQAERIAGLVYSAVIPDVTETEAAPSLDATNVVEGGAAGVSLHALDISGVEPRSAWNARANGGCSSNTNKDWITVHHSVSALQANGARSDHAAAVRGIQAYHMDGRGYCDMGYHFAATADGTVWEGREARFLGAHTGSHNTNNAGIVFIGCFHPTSDCNGLGGTQPTQAQLNGGGAAIGRIAAHYGITINANNVIGHRDNPDQGTACPGDDLHDLLPTLRSIASGGGSPPATSTGKVQGVVWDLSVTTDAAQSEATGARRPGATISVSGGGTTTARPGDSYWSFDLAPGTYTFTASLAGYANASREVQVSAGAALWASIGISPAASALDLTVHVVDVDTGAPIDNATVTVTGADPAQTNASGSVLFNLAAGDVSIAVSAEGYEPLTVSETLVAGVARTVDIELVSVAVEDPEDPDGEEPTGPDGNADPEGNPNGIERITILPPMKAEGGCSSTNASSTAPIALLGLVALLARRRRQ